MQAKSRLFSDKVRHRLLAAATHLGVSATLALLLVLAVTRVWYPPPLFDLAKGKEIFLLLICCDIVLGPMLTLIIFDTSKTRFALARDVLVIAVVQVCAMVYGVTTLLQARPAYIVYNVGQFNVVLANEVTNGDSVTATAQSGLAPEIPWFGPKLVGARLPANSAENNRLIFSSVEGRGDVFQIPHYFVPYDAVKAEVAQRAKSVGQLAALLKIDEEKLVRATASYTSKGIAFRVLPLVIRRTTALAVIDGSTGDLLGIAALPTDY